MTDISFTHQENLILKAEIERLKVKLEITRKALEFYSFGGHACEHPVTKQWSVMEFGNKAREALAQSA